MSSFSFGPSPEFPFVEPVRSLLKFDRTLEQAKALVGTFGKSGYRPAYLLMRYAHDASYENPGRIIESFKFGDHIDQFLLAPALNRVFRTDPKAKGEIEPFVDWIRSKSHDNLREIHAVLGGIRHPAVIELLKEHFIIPPPQHVDGKEERPYSAYVALVNCSVNGCGEIDASFHRFMSAVAREPTGDAPVRILASRIPSPAYESDVVSWLLYDLENTIRNEEDFSNVPAAKRPQCAFDMALHLVRQFGIEALPAAGCLIRSLPEALSAEKFEKTRSLASDPALPAELRLLHAVRAACPSIDKQRRYFSRVVNPDFAEVFVGAAFLWKPKDAEVLDSLIAKMRNPNLPASARTFAGFVAGSSNQYIELEQMLRQDCARDSLKNELISAIIAGQNSTPEEAYLYWLHNGRMPWQFSYQGKKSVVLELAASKNAPAALDPVTLATTERHARNVWLYTELNSLGIKVTAGLVVTTLAVIGGVAISDLPLLPGTTIISSVSTCIGTVLYLYYQKAKARLTAICNKPDY